MNPATLNYRAFLDRVRKEFPLRRLVRLPVCIFAMWLVAALDYRVFPNQDQIAALTLLLCVLAVATLADRILAVVTSISATLSFSYFFIDSVGSLRISSTEGTIAFLAMVTTALTGSHLSIRAELRAEEAERRRSEMERLQRLGTALVAAETVRQAAHQAVLEVAGLFGGAVVLRLDNIKIPFEAGEIAPAERRNPVVHRVGKMGVLELYGMQPSVEVQSALVNLLSLVLDRALAAEDRAQIESAQRGEQLRTTVLNALAHNFRTPLTCIKAAASMMRGSADMPPSYSQDLVEVIDEEADRLDELIRDSLDLARIQSRQANPRVEVCSIADIVAKVLEKMKRYLSLRVVHLSLPAELPIVRGDRFLFEQMVTQVLDNAWKYSGAGARIWISSEQLGDEIILTIRNEGRQIPENESGLVFGRFYRGERTRASIEGTGLGLAIAKTIAEAHGGRIWLEAEPEGPAFRFALPVGAPEEDSDREPHYITD